MGTRNTKYVFRINLSLQARIHTANPLDLSMVTVDVMVACHFGGDSP